MKKSQSTPAQTRRVFHQSFLIAIQPLFTHLPGYVQNRNAAAFLLAYGTAVISMADNVVRPLVLSGRVKMNTRFIFFSLRGGVQAFGIIGLFVGPIVVSLTMALVKMLAAERLEWNSGDR